VVQPIHVQYDNVLISMQPLHHGELLLLVLVLLARAATHAGMQARALALRPALPYKPLQSHGMGRHAGGGAGKSCFPAGILFHSRIESLP
jgi:hypothetical protein